MKKILLFALALTAGAGSILADNLFTGSQPVTWENTLTISADKFANAKVGDELKVSIEAGATDVIELKADGKWLPGTILTRLDGKTEVKATVTEGMRKALATYGLELCGPAFTVTAVDLNPTETVVPEGAVWSGFFWIDGGWNTLELFKTAFDGLTPERIIVNMSPEAEQSKYVLNGLTKWDDDAFKLYGNIEENATSVAIDLNGKSLDSYFTENQNALMIQGHVEEGSSFNITSIVVQPFSINDGVESVTTDNGTVNVYSLAGTLVKKNVPAQNATENLREGLYIIGSKKIIVK